MSTATQFMGGGATQAVINMHSSGGTSSAGVQANAAYNGARELLCGAMTAGVPKSILSFTGAGRVPLLSLYPKDGTARTVRLIVIVDGQASPAAFDATSASISTANTGIFAAGQFDAGFVEGEPILYQYSFEVQAVSSRNESGVSGDQLGLGYKHY